ncbi:protein phosphatase 2C domain-containing protein [Cellulosimicrobium marinum]|uniref:protein phosphatase 2C domain-containing protein n=1 Tax=Cellulosimicrobium marinum TaxID=1638992 RepID=UPI001E3E5232|nr:protein phosphatase 2C domain-containing protein [Cellulosimicrobium marinum]MCB7136385.1 protein phosphatase 2C domain-containing protein [Cellulosimicrobium marinum]
MSAPGEAPAPGTPVPDACPACGEPAHDGARFCEACGLPLATTTPPVPAPPAPTGTDPVPAPLPVLPDQVAQPGEPAPSGTVPGSGTGGAGRPCVRCGGRVAPDGYCEECGEPAASERDHWAESPVPWVAGVCDRGVRHARNEDALALAATGSPPGTTAPDGADRPFAALVVCDGVSSAPDSDVASLAAARAARDTLAAGGPTGARPVEGETTARLAAWSALLGEAARAANDAVLASIPATADAANPPSCTFAAAVVDGPLVVTGWVGDSRAYWLPDAGDARQLSVDDSWAQEMVAQGIPRAQAESSPQAHAITRWLGPDAPDPTARTAATLPDGPGWVLVCSDGLWNYCSEAPDLAALVRGAPGGDGSDPAALADALVRWANAQGGRDNITVALARLAAAPAP